MKRARNATLLSALILVVSSCGSDGGGADATLCTPSPIICSESKPCAAEQVCVLGDTSSWGQCFPATCPYSDCEFHADCTDGDDCAEGKCIGPTDQRECAPAPAVILSTCVEPKDVSGDAPDPGTGPELPPLLDGQVCHPGTTNGCVPGNAYQILRCSNDGTGHIPVNCSGPGGEQSICLADACTECIPNSSRCKDDDQVEKCNETGTAWELDESCDGATTGRRCEEGICQKLCELAAKLWTYMGCDYWAVDLDNAFVPGGSTGFYDAAGSQYAVVVSNPDDKRPATIEVFNVHGPVTEGTECTGSNCINVPLDLSPIPPGGLRILNLPRRDVNGTVIAPLAYRVHASVPITAYQFNPLENEGVFSNDASLLLPENVLGKYYIVMTREQTFDSLRGYLTVVGVRPGETQVSVTVTAKTLASTQKVNGQPVIPSMSAGDSHSFTLQQYDVLNIETNETGADLTGSVILADREVVVFGGSEASNAPNTNHCNFEYNVCDWQLQQGIPVNQAKACSSHEDCKDYITCCADHMEQQMFPVHTWGTRYIASKSYDRNLESDSWRIMAAENGTLVTTFPPQGNIPVLNRGEWYDFESDGHFEVIAEKPILVGQYLAAEHAPNPNLNGIPGPGDAGTGDPAFMLNVPVEQFRTEYVFLAPNKYAYDHVNIIAPVGAEVVMDGQVLDNAQFEPISPDYHVARLQIEDGVHVVRGDQPMGVIVYGYDQYVSYGYPAGLDLKDLNLLKEDF